MSDLRKKLIKLAYENPAIRSHLLPLLKKTASGKWTEIIEWASDPANMKKPATPQDLAQLKNLVRGFSGMISTYTFEHKREYELSEVTFGKERDYSKNGIEVRAPSSATVSLEIEIPLPVLHKLLQEHLDDIGVLFDPHTLINLIKRNPGVMKDLIDEVEKVFNRLELREYEDVKLSQAQVRYILDDYQQHVENDYEDYIVSPYIDSMEPEEVQIWPGTNDISVFVICDVRLGADIE